MLPSLLSLNLRKFYGLTEHKNFQVVKIKYCKICVFTCIIPIVKAYPISKGCINFCVSSAELLTHSGVRLRFSRVTTNANLFRRCSMSLAVVVFVSSVLRLRPALLREGNRSYAGSDDMSALYRREG